jgi:hypothetical protein
MRLPGHRAAARAARRQREIEDRLQRALRQCCGSVHDSSLDPRRLTAKPIPPISPAAARWRSGYAEDCKSLHAGSIPARASTQYRGSQSLVETSPKMAQFCGFLPPYPYPESRPLASNLRRMPSRSLGAKFPVRFRHHVLGFCAHLRHPLDSLKKRTLVFFSRTVPSCDRPRISWGRIWRGPRRCSTALREW